MPQINPKLKALLKSGAAAVYLSAALFAAFAAAYQGLSQYFVNKARFSKSDADISAAIALDRRNPGAYKTRGLLFLRGERYREAAESFAQAARLQPNDYLLWLRLGYSRYKTNDFESALKAYERSAALAPNYASPQRYTGRLLLKTGELEKAFSHLSRAAAIDAKYLPEVMHLARRAYPKNPAAIERAVKPDSPAAARDLALYFIKHHLISEKTKTFLLSDELEKSEKDEIISRLIAAENFRLAFEVWSSARKMKKDENNLLINGDFETEIDPAEKRFGWVIDGEAENTVFKANRSSAFSNSFGLQIEFGGNSEPAVPVFSQLLPVDEERVYRLSFASRSENIITGGLPVIAVTDAATGRILEQSKPLVSSDWETYTLEFSTPARTKAVKIALGRLKCGSSASACPVFGQIQLDRFVLSVL